MSQVRVRCMGRLWAITLDRRGVLVLEHRVSELTPAEQAVLALAGGCRCQQRAEQQRRIYRSLVGRYSAETCRLEAARRRPKAATDAGGRDYALWTLAGRDRRPRDLRIVEAPPPPEPIPPAERKAAARAQRAEHARSMHAKHERASLKHARLAKKWARKVQYYIRVGVLSDIAED